MNIVTFYVNDPHAPRPNRPAHLGANLLLVWQGKLLMERRRDCERWGLPGGGVRRGETLRQCAARELYEETGIRVSPAELLPLKFYDEPRVAAYRDGSVWRMYVKLFALRPARLPELRISAESLEMRFFSQEELEKLDIVPTHRDMAADYVDLLCEDQATQALDYLMGDRLLHADMIEPIRRGHAEILYAGKDGVLLRETNNRVPMLSASGERAAKLLLPMLERPEELVVHHDYERALVEEWLPRVCPCYQVIYPEDETPVWGDIRRLDVTFLPQVLAHYHLLDDPQEMREYLERGDLFGQFLNGRLAGFIGTHREGAIGMLEVFPEYRRQGLGQNLIRHMAKLWQARGYTAFAQIICDNEKSLRLQKKLGARRSKTMLYWMNR